MNLLGLTLDFLGIVLASFYGLLPLSRTEGDEQRQGRDNRLQRFRLGFAAGVVLVVAGFIFQLGAISLGG